VWVSEGFDVALARKLRDAVDAANVPLGSGPTMTAKTSVPAKDLMSGLSGWLGGFGMMRVTLR
jgi:hypothetical protein